MQASGLSGIVKDNLIQVFNATYFNKEFYQNHTPALMHLDYETNREPYHPLFDEVCELVYFNDTFKQMGLGFDTLYNCCDYGMLQRIREFIVKQNDKKVKRMNDMQAQMDQRQERILKGTRND